MENDIRTRPTPAACLASTRGLPRINSKGRATDNSLFKVHRRSLSVSPFQKAFLLAAFLAPGGLIASPATATTARHYDCSKPGNANKAACKSSAAAPAKPATPSRTITTATTTKTTTRQYDCTKAGNANKAACKAAGAQTPTGKSPGAVKTTTSTATTTTDCSKWYNKARAACRTSTASSGPRTAVAPAPKPAPKMSPRANVWTENNNPSGATAQCKDGTYSHAAHHAGACGHHGGVAKWLS